MDQKSLLTRDGVLEWVDGVLATTRKEYEEEPNLLPMAYILGMRDPKTGQKTKEPFIALVVLDWGDQEEAKSRGIHMLKNMVAGMEAYAVLWVSEVWMKETNVSDRETQARIREHGVVGEQDRKEAIHVVLDYSEAPFQWVAMIERDSAGNPTLKPFEKRPAAPGVTSSGRLSSFIQPQAKGVA